MSDSRKPRPRREPDRTSAAHRMGRVLGAVIMLAAAAVILVALFAVALVIIRAVA